MTITEKIMEAIAEDIQEMMCDNCEHIKNTAATFDAPPESECPGDFEPWDGGCRRHDEYEAVEERVKECEQDIQVIIFGRVCAACPGK